MKIIIEAFQLDRKTALVTGASSGIGQAIAVALAAAGADIVAMSRAQKGPDQTAGMITGLGRKYCHVAADFRDRDSLYRAITEVKREIEKVDILINNAGIILRKPAVEHPDEYWDEVMAVNLTSPFILTREIGKEMIKRGRGKIVFTCSLLTFQGGINVPSYAASKSGVGQLVKAFANEWAPLGLNVNGIAPGYVATRNTQALRDDPARSKSILERIPAGRWAEPQDFAGPVVFLASAASDYVNGAILLVDGGWMGR